MKRITNPPSSSPSKRVRTDYYAIFDDESAYTSFQTSATTQRPSYISGVNRMTTNSSSRKTRVIHLQEVGGSSLLQVHLTGKALRRLKAINVTIKPGDELSIALRGCKLLEPSKIEFSDGVMLQLRNCKGEPRNRLIDTWKKDDDDWFRSVAGLDFVSPMCMDQTPITSATLSPPMKAISASKAISEERETAIKDGRARLHNIEQKTTRSDVTERPGARPPTPQSDSKPLTVSSRQNTTAQHVSNTQAVSILTSDPSGLPSSYTILKRATRGVHNVIAIVHSAKPAWQSSSGDWCTTLQLIDPSIKSADDLGMLYPTTYKVNCFTPKHREWCPEPNPGDVIVMRGLKITPKDITAVGYADRLSWAIYKASERVYHHSGGTQIPTKDLIHSRSHCPFYQPNPAELKYSQWLLKWRRALEVTRKENIGTVYQIGEGSARTTSRERLICDVQPDEFFDTIVEVLHIWDDWSDRFTEIFVTDYTTSDKVHPTRTNWCPEALSKMVLKIECWDKAHHPASRMEVNKIYSLRNVRAKYREFLEGRLNDAKIQELNPDEKVVNLQLKNFLVRQATEKDTIQRLSGKIVTMKEIKCADECKLIGDTPRGQTFTCIVEVLAMDGDILFVTDHTKHDLLVRDKDDFLVKTITFNKPHLVGRVLSIQLQSDAQIEDAKALPSGSFCVINGLKITDERIPGTIDRKGNACVICEILENSAKYGPNIQKLKARRDRLLKVAKSKETQSREKNAVQTAPDLLNVTKSWAQSETKSKLVAIERSGIDIQRGGHRYKRTTLAFLRDSELGYGRYAIDAQMIEFYPELHQCVVSDCTNCSRRISDNLRACTACNDVAHQYVRHAYMFFLRLGDGRDEQHLRVCAGDECPLFRGLKRVRLSEDPNALGAFTERVQPILGPSDTWLSGDSPKLTFLIRTSRNQFDGERTHFLEGYEALRFDI